MFDFLAGVLAELYKLWPSYGGAIILFTALIMLVLSPLSIKSTRSMIAMQRVGPEVKKLQAKHKGDREALNREMMAFYQEHNINPFSSCLPLLLQIPVFIVLYQVLIGLTRRANPGDPTSVFNPKYLEGEDTPLALALRSANEMVSFGMDLSQSAWNELRTGGLVVALPFVVLVALVVVTSIIQQRQVQGRNPSAMSNPQQQMIAKVLPFIFIPISVSIPAGVVIYFVVSNLVRIGQQALVTRLDFKDLPAGDDDTGAGKGKGSAGDGGSGSRDGSPGGRPGRSKGSVAKGTVSKGAGTVTKGGGTKGGGTRGGGTKGTAKGAVSKGAGTATKGGTKARPTKGDGDGTGGRRAGTKERATTGRPGRATKRHGSGTSANGTATNANGTKDHGKDHGTKDDRTQATGASANGGNANGGNANGRSTGGENGNAVPPRPRKRKRKRR